jgi:hypothetical protein
MGPAHRTFATDEPLRQPRLRFVLDKGLKADKTRNWEVTEGRSMAFLEQSLPERPQQTRSERTGSLKNPGRARAARSQGKTGERIENGDGGAPKTPSDMKRGGKVGPREEMRSLLVIRQPLSLCDRCFEP